MLTLVGFPSGIFLAEVATSTMTSTRRRMKDPLLERSFEQLLQQVLVLAWKALQQADLC